MLHKLLVFLSFFFLLATKIHAKENWARQMLSQMSLQEKIGQLFVIPAVSCPAKEQATEQLASAVIASPYNMERNHVISLITHYHIGGIIFLHRSTPERQIALTNEFQTHAQVPLIIMQDCEWGLSMRLDSTIAYPRAQDLGALNNPLLVYQVGKEIGHQCRAIGVHMNLAPVADINSNPNNPVIGSRSFGTNPLTVMHNAHAFACGLRDAGVLACAKHFPGHGDTSVDSHLSLPTIPHSKAILEARELAPFRYLIKHNIPAIMLAHLQVPAYDSRPYRPASLSYALTTTLLRQQLGFMGLTITDGLGMRAITKHFSPGELELEAFLAGNDILLCPLNVPKAVQLIACAVKTGKVSESELNARVLRILLAKERVNLHKNRFVTTCPDLNRFADQKNLDQHRYSPV